MTPGTGRAWGAREAPVRLFIAVEFPAEVCERLWDETTALREAAPSVKWVAPALMHITLKFFGERRPSARWPIGEAMARAVWPRSPIACELRTLGAFPNFRLPHVVWVGIDDGGLLARLAADVDSALVRAGIERERRAFNPHLTLGRVRDETPREELDALRLAAERTQMSHHAVVGHVMLVRSTLGLGGPRYDVLESVPLGGGAP